MSALTPAHSHWIQSHGYSNGVMTLITKTGEAYAAKIPESRYSEFLKAPSQGSFFNLYIKPFATVTKVDVAEAVALVEKAKTAVASGTYTYTVTRTTAPKAKRKAPAKSLLPNKPWLGTGPAWIDFRCIGDPTTGSGLVKALKRFIENRDKKYQHYIPYTRDNGATVSILALESWGSGFINKKYLKAFSPGIVTDNKALANAYRSAYRSWVRRQEAKKAKVKAASEPVKGEAYAWTSVPKMVETAAKEVFAGGWSGKTAEQVRAERAERVLSALLNGDFSVTSHRSGVTLNLWGSSNESFKLGEKRP